MQWTLVVPLKPLARAKSRLSDTAADGVRPGLALAFAQDTVAAALAAAAVGGVVVVTDDPLAARELTALGARTVPEDNRNGSRDGLNAALRHGTAVVRAIRPQSPVAALNADLPALRPGELTRVLNAAAEFPVLSSRTPPAPAPPCSPRPPATTSPPSSAPNPASATAAPAPWNSPSPPSTPCGRTSTPATTSAPPSVSASVPVRPQRPRAC